MKRDLHIIAFFIYLGSTQHPCCFGSWFIVKYLKILKQEPPVVCSLLSWILSFVFPLLIQGLTYISTPVPHLTYGKDWQARLARSHFTGSLANMEQMRAPYLRGAMVHMWRSVHFLPSLFFWDLVIWTWPTYTSWKKKTCHRARTPGSSAVQDVAASVWASR